MQDLATPVSPWKSGAIVETVGIEYRLLGPLEVFEDGQALAVGSRKQRALLAILLLNANRVVSRDVLIDALWGEVPPPTASQGLDTYVSRLRKALGHGANGAGPLQTVPGGYRFQTAPGQLDLERFASLAAEGRRELEVGNSALAVSRLREAAALWRGRALADLEHELFARGPVAQLEEERLTVIEDRLEAELVLGRHKRITSELEMLVADHPLRERLRAQLMLGLYRSGRQSEALAAYRSGYKLLRDELGLEPGPQLRALEAAILRQDAELGADAAPSAPVLGSVRSWRRLTAAAACLALVVVVLFGLLIGPGDSSRAVPRLADSGVTVVDLDTRRAVAAIELRSRPAAATRGWARSG